MKFKKPAPSLNQPSDNLASHLEAKIYIRNKRVGHDQAARALTRTEDCMRFVSIVIAALCVLTLSAFGEPASPDNLLDRLAGTWVLSGEIAGAQTTHDVTAEWLLGHEYLRLHEISRDKDDRGQPQYEAIILLGRDPKSGEYQCLWLDSTTGGGLSPDAFARGTPEADAIPFLFREKDGTVSFNNTFAYDRAGDSWTWRMDNVSKDGTAAPFGRVKLVRAQRTTTGSVDEPRAGSGAFAFANENGTEVLALKPLADPDAIHYAIGSSASVHRVAYAREQLERSESTGREMSYNFANLEGQVYRVIGDTIPADETCYLTGDSVLVASVIPADSIGFDSCGPGFVDRISQARQRQVENCWPLAKAGQQVDFYLVRFARVDTSALAALVLNDSEGPPYFADFPAAYGPDNEPDVWRVDDQGDISPEGFGILFVARERGKYVVALTWGASEGEYEGLLISAPGNTLTPTVEAYRYWVPK